MFACGAGSPSHPTHSVLIRAPRRPQPNPVSHMRRSPVSNWSPHITLVLLTTGGQRTNTLLSSHTDHENENKQPLGSSALMSSNPCLPTESTWPQHTALFPLPCLHRLSPAPAHRRVPAVARHKAGVAPPGPGQDIAVKKKKGEK